MIRILAALLLAMEIEATAADRAESDAAALTRIRAEITRLVGEARCRNLVHCRLLPLGMDACGVPAEYVAFSSGFTDVATLETKASEFAFVYDELMMKQTTAADCKAGPEPQAVCIDNRCKVVIPPTR